MFILEFSWIQINLNTENYVYKFQFEFKLMRIDHTIFQCQQLKTNILWLIIIIIFNSTINIIFQADSSFRVRMLGVANEFFFR